MIARTLAPRSRASRIAARVSAVSPGLGDADHQDSVADDRVAVAVLGGDVHLDRDPRPLLDRVAADQTRVVGGAAGDDHDPLHVAQEGVVDLELGEVDPLVARQPAGDRFGDGVGLFVDLLQHEGLVAVLLGRGLVPGDLLRLALDRVAVGVGDADPGGVDRDDLVVLDRDREAGLGEEGGDRRGEEALAVADAGDQRALLAGADQQPGLVGVHGDEGVVAAQLGEGGADGGGEVAVVVARDQVGDDLGVGFGAELLPFVLEPAAQLGVVLDDPVEDDVDAIGAVAVGVRVLLGDPAVGRPAGVGDAGRRRRCGDRDPASALGSSIAARRLARLPTARTLSTWPSSITETPAES